MTHDCIWNGCDREKEDNLEALVDNVLDPVRGVCRGARLGSGYDHESLESDE